MNLEQKAKVLSDIREAISKEDEEYEKKVGPLKAQRDAVQSEVLEDLKTSGQFSARFSFATITRAVRKTPFVSDESAVMKWLSKNKLKKEYTAVQLTDSFKKLMSEAIKTDKKIDGVEIKETEYLSLTKADETKERRKEYVE